MESSNSSTELGWHFCALKDNTPILRDGTILEIGREYRHEGVVKICSSGYHDSLRPLDALSYAPGPFLCRTRAIDVQDSQPDKRVSRGRVALVGEDVSRCLIDFATRAAYCALLRERELGREPDVRSWDAIRVRRLWLAGKVSIEEVATAYAATDAAAHAAYAAYAHAAHAAYAAYAYAASYSAARDFLNQLLLECLPDSLKSREI